MPASTTAKESPAGASSEGDRVFAARAEDQLLRLRPFWDEWKSHPTVEWNACRALAAGGESVATVAFVLGDTAAPRAALVAMEQVSRVPVTLGYWRVANPRLRMLAVKNGGAWLGPATDDAARAIVAGMRREMRERGVTMVHFEDFAVEHPLVRAAAAAGAVPMRPEPDVNWRISIPGSYAEFLAACSKNTRRNLKRYPEKFLEEFGPRASVHVLDKPEDFPRIVAELESVARLSYHAGFGAGFQKTRDQLALIQAALALGTYRAFVLDIDGEAAAFWDGRACGSTFFTDFTAYAPRYAQSRPGWYLLAWMIERLCGDPAIDTIDFGQGDAQYKQMLGTVAKEVTSLAFWAPTARARSLRALLRTTAWGTKAARRVLDRIGLLGKVKRFWRRRLSDQTGT